MALIWIDIKNVPFEKKIRTVEIILSIEYHELILKDSFSIKCFISYAYYCSLLIEQLEVYYQ